VILYFHVERNKLMECLRIAGRGEGEGRKMLGREQVEKQGVKGEEKIKTGVGKHKEDEIDKFTFFN
jgi:hypothetical protein